MKISERIELTIESWRIKWGEALKSFLATFLSWGLDLFFGVLGKAAAPKLKPFIDMIEATGKVPPEFQPILEELKVPTGEVSALFAQSAGGSLIGGAFGRIVDAILLPVAYSVNSVTQNVILSEGQYIMLWLRKFITDEQFNEFMHWLGHDDTDITNIKEVAQVRLTPEAVARLWLRDKPAYEHLWKDLADSGLDEGRIEALRELAYAIPTPQEVVLFMGREAFEEDAVLKYGLDDEFERIDLKWFEQTGIRPEVAKLYWRAHWQHPAFREMTELLHRGEVTADDVYEWYRLVEIPPYWRDKLTSISWDLPNRIELRMMARYGLVDKSFLLEQLKMVGLREDFRDVAADMMLAMGIRTDLSTRFGKGWITPEVVQQELVDSGLSTEVQERMYQWIVKNTGTERVVKERDLTLSDIYKGIKKGFIGYSQGLELIRDMGYDEWEAKLKLEVNVGALEGSPETYLELKRLTQLYRQSQGLSAKIPSNELIQAEKDVLEAEQALKDVQAKARVDISETEARASLEAAKLTFHDLSKKERGEV